MIIKKNIFLLALLILMITDCKGIKYKEYKKTTYSMGTVLTIIIFSESKKKAKYILKECFKLADDLEKKVSCKIENSTITNLNKKKNMLINDDFVYNLIVESINYSKKTNGAFDPSLYHLIDIWGFETGSSNIPNVEQIKKTILKCGYSNIVINDKKITLKNNISLDLGGIAKGKIIGEIAKFIKKQGIKNFLINGGGDIVINGTYQNKRLWKIAIIDPFDNNNFLGILELADCSIVTSGDYERNFIGNDEKLYHHIIDPKTGYPTKNGVHSVTVISKDPVKADVFATALFVMGKDVGLGFAKKNKYIDAIFVMGNKKDKQIFSTDNIIVNKKDNGGYDFIYRLNTATAYTTKTQNNN
ncbi:MAG: FAD:protein FMN transferase [Spirochaetes bacterium]|nr:FAD:protein FMN transferase [Spirochaetota bacterium]